MKEVENEKQSLVTALKKFHDDYANEIENRSRCNAQVNQKSGNDFEPSLCNDAEICTQPRNVIATDDCTQPRDFVDPNIKLTNRFLYLVGKQVRVNQS